MTFIVDGTNGGFFPSWTTAGRPAAPSVGEIGYNSTNGQFDVYTSSGWVSMLNTTSTTNKATASQMPTGSVIQIVQGTAASQVTSTSTTYADTNLSASITPSSSTNKVLAVVCQPMGVTTGAAVGYGFQTNAGLRLVRGSTVLITPAADSGGSYSLGISTGAAPGSGTIVIWGIVSFCYLDSPATTSATTYKTQFAKGTSGMGPVYANDAGGGSFITLMEIVA